MSISTSAYHPFYCEENVWHMCRELRFAHRSPAAVFVSGRSGEVVMWHQKQAPVPEDPILWDYHVFMLVRGPWEIWDFDTLLSVPTPAALYLRQSFRPWVRRDRGYEPLFRVVQAEELMRAFASDRGHMRDEAGQYTKAPPPWNPIAVDGALSTLGRFIDMGDPIAGEVVDYSELWTRLYVE